MGNVSENEAQSIVNTLSEFTFNFCKLHTS